MARTRAPRPPRPSQRPSSPAERARLVAKRAEILRRAMNLRTLIEAKWASRGLLPGGGSDRYPDPSAGP